MADKFLNFTGLSHFLQKLKTLLATKQDTLVSGTNIKTINNESLLGSGNIDVSGGGSDVFLITYDSTSFADLRQAINDQKILIFKDSAGRIYTVLNRVENAVYFIKVRYIYSGNVSEGSFTYREATVTSENVWSSDGSIYLSKTFIDAFLANKADISDLPSQATDDTLGTMKLNSSESITLNANGQLQVGGRLGQFPNGGVFYPTDIAPANVGGSTFMMTDGAKNLSLAGRTFGIMAGANVTCKSTAAGATQYRVSNTQSNRFALFAAKGGRAAIDQTDAITNGTALITSIKFANGNDISAYFGPTESSNDIIITLERTVNPSAATTKLRVYGTSGSSDVIVVGQGCGASGGKAISLGQSCYASGNQCIAFGNASLSLANNSVAFGHTNLVNKQFCFAAGQGHDFTNASNGTGAVGIASQMDSNTAFAVGNGVFNANGDITRSNAFEVTKDGGVVLKSPNGTRYKITVSNTGTLTTTAL